MKFIAMQGHMNDKKWPCVNLHKTKIRPSAAGSGSVAVSTVISNE